MAYGWRTKILTKDLRSVFGGPCTELNAHVVRLSVLYEDLRIEIVAAGSRHTFKSIEAIGRSARQQYFIRRSIATLVEFSECIQRLNGCPEFAPYKRKLGEKQSIRSKWDEAAAFFETNHEILQAVRNDVGGHFGEQAARAVVNVLKREPEPIVDRIEFSRDWANFRAGTRLWFAEELAAQALHRHHGTTPHEQFRSRLFETCKQGYMHAASCVHMIAYVYLSERFAGN